MSCRFACSAVVHQMVPCQTCAHICLHWRADSASFEFEGPYMNVNGADSLGLSSESL